MTNWQAKRAATFAPRQAKLVVTPGTSCHFCRHPKSSHSSLVLTAPCRVGGCDCPVFDPICGCGHLLSEHTWGVVTNPWECAFCKCLKFGAAADGAVERRDRVEVASAPPPRSRPPKAPAVIHEATTPGGEHCRWGRRELALFDCHAPRCHDQATYWTTRAYAAASGKWVTVKANFCGPHFRRWANRHMPPEQLTFPGTEPAQNGS